MKTNIHNLADQFYSKSIAHLSSTDKLINKYADLDETDIDDVANENFQYLYSNLHEKAIDLKELLQKEIDRSSNDEKFALEDAQKHIDFIIIESSKYSSDLHLSSSPIKGIISAFNSARKIYENIYGKSDYSDPIGTSFINIKHILNDISDAQSGLTFSIINDDLSKSSLDEDELDNYSEFSKIYLEDEEKEKKQNDPPIKLRTDFPTYKDYDEYYKKYYKKEQQQEEKDYIRRFKELNTKASSTDKLINKYADLDETDHSPNEQLQERLGQLYLDLNENIKLFKDKVVENNSNYKNPSKQWQDYIEKIMKAIDNILNILNKEYLHSTYNISEKISLPFSVILNNFYYNDFENIIDNIIHIINEIKNLELELHSTFNANPDQFSQEHLSTDFIEDDDELRKRLLHQSSDPFRLSPYGHGRIPDFENLDLIDPHMSLLQRQEEEKQQKDYDRRVKELDDLDEDDEDENHYSKRIASSIDKLINKYARKRSLRDFYEEYEDPVNPNLKYNHIANLRKKYLSDDAIELLNTQTPISQNHPEFNSFIDYLHALSSSSIDPSDEYDKLKKVIGDYEVDRSILDPEAMDYYHQAQEPESFDTIPDFYHDFIGKSIGRVTFYLLDNSSKRLTNEEVASIIDPSLPSNDNEWKYTVSVQKSGQVAFACFVYQPIEASIHKNTVAKDLKINKIPVDNLNVHTGDRIQVTVQYDTIADIPYANPNDVNINLKLLSNHSNHTYEDDLDSHDNPNLAVAKLDSLANKFLNKYAKK